MHPLISSIVMLAGTAGSSFPQGPSSLQLASNDTLQSIPSNTTILRSGWPSLPLRHHIRGTLFITINICPPPDPRLQKDRTLEDLIALEMVITYGGSFTERLPTVTAFDTDKIIVTFFADDTHSITRKQAKVIVNALWDLTFQYGPRAIGRQISRSERLLLHILR